MAYLTLAAPISEFDDGVCFLCMPTEEVPLGCLKDACFVVAPHTGESELGLCMDCGNTKTVDHALFAQVFCDKGNPVSLLSLFSSAVSFWVELKT
jgi:hypothetical protein